MNKSSVSGKNNTSDLTPPVEKNAGDSSASIETPGNVDKIRDILFGNQMRDYEKRFARFEERLLKETTALREDIKNRLASLESYVKTELEALQDDLKTSKNAQSAALKDLGQEVKENAKTAEKKAGQIEEQASKAQRELRQLILEEAKRLSEEIEHKHAALSQGLDRESTELRSILTDRRALADLFTEMALRLKDEFKIPSNQ
jgi:hypothetical protein